jgi:hypothetical protein
MPTVQPKKACSINRIHVIKKIWPHKFLTVAIAKRQYLNVGKDPVIKITSICAVLSVYMNELCKKVIRIKDDPVNDNVS